MRSEQQHDVEHDTRAQGLRDLSLEECWEMIDTRRVGRLVWNGPAGLTAIPVNYRARAGEIVMHTAAYSAVARECDDSPVAFQVDHIDPLSRSGWSVLARGTAHLDLSSPDDDVDTWPAGLRPVRLRIDVREVTGRRLPAPR